MPQATNFNAFHEVQPLARSEAHHHLDPDEAEALAGPSVESVRGLGDSALETEGNPVYEDVYTKEYDPITCEVKVTSSLTLEDYERVTPPTEMARLREEAKELEGKRVVRINATARGGGVAIMNQAWVHMMNLLGVDAHWYALKPDQKAAEVTKWKFHNVLQDVAEPGTQLTEADQKIYDGYVERNADILEEPIREADVLILDDWQTSGLIPYIKGGEVYTAEGSEYRDGLNPEAPILFRDHIHTRGDLMVTPGTPQKITWDFLWHRNRIKDADVFIAHPRDEFVPPNVPNEKVLFMPATGDILDDLNRDITPLEKAAGIEFINNQLAMNEDQQPLDDNRPRIVLIARFDESKGMPQGIESYAKAREKMLAAGMKEEELPQLVVLGNGSVDDPSGKLVLKQIMELRSEEYGDIKDDLKIVRVPHNDVAINALLKSAKLALQPSTKEGFESRVTDAILQGVPVIGSDQGGIPLQIKEGQSGHIINPYDTEQWADRLSELMIDDRKYAAMQEQTKQLAKTHNYQFTTIPNVLNWLYLSNQLLKVKAGERPALEGNRQWVREMVLAKHDSDTSHLVT
jgi:glycosyltransferase involved in cell wall biosynthesis